MSRPVGMNTPGERTRFCQTCQRISEEGIPDGWYQVTVTDSAMPKGRPYRYLGLFCSMSCLAQAMPRMTAVEADIVRRNGSAQPRHRTSAEVNRERRRNGLPELRT